MSNQSISSVFEGAYLLLWIFGALALLFLAFLIMDAIRARKRQLPGGKRPGLRSTVRELKEEFKRRAEESASRRPKE